MADLPNIDELTKIASFLAPGFIILGIRARFRTGRAPDLASGVIYYILASSAYYAAAAPLFNVQWGVTIPQWLWAFLHYFLVPLVVGGSIVVIDLICPPLSGPKTMLVWTTKGTLNAEQEAQAGRDYRQAA